MLNAIKAGYLHSGRCKFERLLLAHLTDTLEPATGHVVLAINGHATFRSLEVGARFNITATAKFGTHVRVYELAQMVPLIEKGHEVLLGVTDAVGGAPAALDVAVEQLLHGTIVREASRSLDCLGSGNHLNGVARLNIR